jgi:hypothetical protein
MRVMLVNLGKFCLVFIFQIEKIVTGCFSRHYQLVKFRLNGLFTPVLCALNQKNYQKSDDGCSGVDQQLPCWTEVKPESRYCPKDHNGDSRDERDRSPCMNCDIVGKAREP